MSEPGNSICPSILKLNRNQPGKGEIMKRGFIGNFMRVRSLWLFVIALAVLISSGPAMAQVDTANWRFVNLSVNAQGASSSIDSVTGILFGLDGDEDGAIDGLISGGNSGFLTSPTHLGFEDGSPLLANIESGESVYLFAVVTGVDSSVVSSIKQGGSTTDVKNAITATLPGLLTESGDDIAGAKVTDVTGITEDDAFGIDADKANTLVCWWKIDTYVVGAETDDPSFHGAGLSASMEIIGSATEPSTGNSNLIGVEITDPEADTVTGPAISSIEETSTKEEYTNEDEITFDIEIDQHSDLDGEPDAYFSVGDPYTFDGVQGLDVASGADTIDTVTSALTLSLTLKNRGLNVASSAGVQTANPSNDPVVLSVTCVIKDATHFTTRGAFETLLLDSTITDDVGAADTLENEDAKIDTLPIYITDVIVEPEDTSFSNYHNKVGPDNPDNNEVVLTVKIQMNGESQTNLGWLDMTFEEGGVDWAANDGPVDLSYNDANSKFEMSGSDYEIVEAPKIVNTVPNIGGGTAQGVQVKVKAKTKADPKTNYVTGAGFFITAQDNAENPAVFYDVLNEALTSTSDVGDSTTTLDTTIDKAVLVSLVDPLEAILVESATVAVDNSPPIVQNVDFDVIALPDDFLSSGASDAFNLLKQATEFVEVAEANGEIVRVTKGTSKIVSSASNDITFDRQSTGSYTRVVVEFDLAAETGDIDQLLPDSLSDATSEYIANGFNYSIDGTVLGYTPDTEEDSDRFLYSEDWTLEDTLLADDGVAYATFHSKAGIDLVGAKSISDGTVFVTMQDSVFNKSGPRTSNDIIVDVSGPVLGFTGTDNDEYSVASTAENATYSEAQTVVQLLDKDGTVINKTTNPSENDISVQAGYSIIVSATFNDWDQRSDEEALKYTAYGKTGEGDNLQLKGFFPYLFNEHLELINTEAERKAYVIDAASTAYGEHFKTISADFSDFVVGKADILPTNISVLRDEKPLDNVIPSRGDIVVATWEFKIGSKDTLNSSISTESVRQVTFAARDLSGNVSRAGVDVAYADFVVPIVAVHNFEITNNLVEDLVVESSSSSDLTESDFKWTSDASIDSATITKDSEILLVARIGTGSGGGGPFDENSEWLTADFSAYGGGSSVTPTFISAVYSATESANHDTWANNKNEIATKANNASIVYATFSLDAEDLNPDTFQEDGATATITAIGKTGAVVTEETVGLGVDSIEPTGPYQIAMSEVSSPAGEEDDLEDFNVRAGSVIEVTGVFLADVYDTIDNTRFIADLSNYVEGATNVEAATPDITFVNGDVRYATVSWRTTVSDPPPSDVTYGPVEMTAYDASNLEGKTYTSNFFFVYDDTPAISTIWMDAKRDVNYVTDTIGIAGSFEKDAGGQWIVVDSISGLERTDDELVAAGITVPPTTTVNAGDTVRLVVRINTSDPVFSGVDDAIADFSSYGAGASVNADEIAFAGTTLLATFEVEVGNATSVRAENATIPITVIDPANNEGKSVAPGFNVDNTKPEMVPSLLEVKNYEGGELAAGDELDPGNGVTTTIKAAFDWPDADDQHGYPGSLLAAALRDHGNETAAFREIISVSAAAVEVFEPEFANLDLYQGDDDNGAIIPSWIVISGDGPTVTSASSEAQIRASTNSRITAYFGFDTSVNPITSNIDEADNAGLMFKTNTNKESAWFSIRAKDNVGNVTSYETAEIELDSVAPNIANMAMDVVYDGQTANVDYQPALYNAAGKIVRPTRVAPGTALKLSYDLSDTPDKTDQIENGFIFDNADAENYSVSISGGSEDDLNISGNGVTLLTSPNSSKSSINVTFDVGSDADTTLGYNLANPLAPGSYYPNSSAAAFTLYATDTKTNWKSSGYTVPRGNDAYPIEIDNQAPVIAGQAFFRKDEGQENAITVSDLESKIRAHEAGDALLNARASDWIIWAATIVVDGTDEMHLDGPNVNWRGALQPETGVKRLVDGSDKSGRSILVGSATRTVVFVTSAVKVVSNPLAKLPEQLSVTVSDMFGNIDSVPTQLSDETPLQVAINARGPGATALTMNVDGVSEEAGANFIGIGSNDVDAASATFELTPGNEIVLNATITTDDGTIPEEIYADLSALYPPELSNTFDEVVPSSVELTEDELVKVEWRHIFFDFTNLNPAGGLAIADRDVVGNISELPEDATLAVGKTLTLVGIAGDDKPDEAADQDALETKLAALTGLPGIVVQPGANPNMEAVITITVNDADDIFEEFITQTTEFAIDSEFPSADTAITLQNLFMDQFYGDIETNSAGFPVAPNAPSSTPNRVRGGDSLSIGFTMANPNISMNGDDRFRYLLSDNIGDIFTLDTSNMEQAIADVLNSVTADLTSLVPGQNTVPIAGENYIQLVEGTDEPTVILATYEVEVSSNLGTTAAASRRIALVTPTIMDDARNIPVDTPWVDTLDASTGIAVDNNKPNFNTVQVRLAEGTARTKAGQPLAEGSILPANAIVEPDSRVNVIVEISETVDSPLDIFYNPNFGDISINANNFTIDPDDQNIGNIQTSGSFITGRFNVRIPAVNDQGRSVSAFSFVVRATDTVGNSRSSNSATYLLDAAPVITVTRDGVEVEENVFTVNAQDTLSLTSNAFDAGGIDFVQWNVLPDPPVGFTASTDGSGFIKDPDDSSQSLDITLNVTPMLNTDPSAANVMTATSDASDIDSNAVSTSAYTINFNQPALFDEILAATEVTAGASMEIDTVVEAAEAGWNMAAGEDVREVTIPEGSNLHVIVSASDANRDNSVLVSANANTNLDAGQFDAWFNAQDLAEGEATANFPSGIGQAEFLFVPSFTAITGTAESATFALDLTAGDSSDIENDYSTLLVNIIPAAATPELNIVSIFSGEEEVNVTEDEIQVNEQETLEITATAVDPGDELIDFTINTVPEPLTPVELVTSGTSTVTAVINYTPSFNESDIQTQDNPADPFDLELMASNGTWTESETKQIDILNVSQAPEITTTVSVDGEPAVAINNGGTTDGAPGQLVQFLITVTDPDGDSIFTNYNVSSEGEDLNSSFVDFRKTGTQIIKATLTVTVPTDIADNILVAFGATDQTGAQNSHQYTILTVEPEQAPVVDEVILAQGLGGSSWVNIRNFDPNSSTPVNQGLSTITAMPEAFNKAVGGGRNRGAYVSPGDVNNDGKVDVVTTFGPVIEDATYPNMFIVRDPVTGETIGHPRDAFPVGDDLPVHYKYGDIPAAVGDFINSGTDQIALAQGFGGNGVVRLWQYTGRPAPFGWKVVGQFAGLVANASTTNASGYVSLDAGDVDGDGVDELIVGQGYSATSSQTLFQLLDIQQTGGVEGTIANVAKRTPWAGFAPQYRGNGGAEYVIADINGDGTKEIIAGSTGNQTGIEAANGTPISSFINVIMPKIADGSVSGYDYANTGTMTTFTLENNPSGAISIAAGEIDGVTTNGAELVVTTGAIYNVGNEDTLSITPLTTTGGFTVNGVSTNSMTVEPESVAPNSKMRIIKLHFDGTTVNGWTGVVINDVNYGRFQGFNAFVATANPTSSAVFVDVANTHTIE